MIDSIKKYLLKYKEIITYLIFGGLTTVINFIVYIACTKGFGINEIISNVIAWVISVLFAYITNKIYVFDSKSKDIKTIFKEIISFFACRVATLVVFDIALFWLMVNVLNINDIAVKVINQVLVIVFNYVFSRVIIFKK